MPRSTIMYLQLLTLTYGFLISSSLALMGNGSRTARAHEFNYAVGIAEKGNGSLPNYNRRLSYCTGSLISKRSVLTAAHCVIGRNVGGVEVIAGNHNLLRGQIYDIERWITYDEWMYRRRDVPSFDDIAIIILNGAGVEEAHNHPVELSPYDPDQLIENRVFIAGWGTILSGISTRSLRRATLKIISREECNARGSQVQGVPYSLPSPSYFCSAATPWVVTTGGDAGGPVVSPPQKLIGVTVGPIPVPPGRWQESNTQALRSVQVNTHLRLQRYRDFIRTFKL